MSNDDRLRKLERQVSDLSSSLILAWSIIEYLLEHTETIDDTRLRQQLMQLQALKPDCKSYFRFGAENSFRERLGINGDILGQVNFITDTARFSGVLRNEYFY